MWLLLSFLLLYFVIGNTNAHNEIEDVNPDDWVQECLVTFHNNDISNDPVYIEYSNHNLVTKPSGLCTDTFSCAFKDCAKTGIDENLLSFPLTNETTYKDMENLFGTLNLPSKIAFPKTAGDVASAIKYAKDKKLAVSIKATSHSYTGSSTVGGSLQLNLRDLKTYADSVVECGDGQELGENRNACELAIARGKKALIKVGGGESWSNVYLTVDASQKYTVIGGGAGSVGAAGGWLQGGGWSTGLERLYGLGVDQVLEFEMVLADGRHVKFGPSKWEKVENYIYPRTLAVDGTCDFNIDGSTPSWKPCNKPIPPFKDLWFAVRGGGGGSFGVVTALKYQLHDHMPLTLVIKNQSVLQSLLSKIDGNKELGMKLKDFYFHFLVDLLYNPTKLGISDQISAKCGYPDLPFDPFVSTPLLDCYDGVWEDTIVKKWVELVDAEEDPAFATVKEDFKNWYVSLSGVFHSHAAMSKYFAEPFHPKDKIPDKPLPQWYVDRGTLFNDKGVVVDGGWCSAVIPKSWLAKGRDEKDLAAVFAYQSGQHTTGGYMNIAHDQMTAVTPFQRESGLSSTVLAGLDKDLHSRLLSSFLKETQDKGAPFPGISEINHICVGSYGPLKDDWSEPCPREWSREKKEKSCIGLQESIWGTDILARLQNIKYKVDPDNLFKCHLCIEPKKPTESTKASSGTLSLSSLAIFMIVIATVSYV